MVDGPILPLKKVSKGKFRLPDATNKESKEGHNDASQSGTQSLSQSSPPTLDQKPAETSSPAESPKVVTTPLRNQAPPLYAAPEPKQSDKQPSEHQETGMMGKLFCFATDLDSVPQEEVERRVEAAGGKIGPSVGQRTSYLVLGGNTADGRPAEESGKYQRFLQLREMGKATAEVLREAEFLKMLPQGKVSSHAEVAKDVAKDLKDATVQRPFNWVDIFAPFQLTQLIGNTAVTQRLTEWLRDWENVCLRGQKKMQSPSRPGSFENINVGKPGWEVAVCCCCCCCCCSLSRRLQGIRVFFAWLRQGPPWLVP